MEPGAGSERETAERGSECSALCFGPLGEEKQELGWKNSSYGEGGAQLCYESATYPGTRFPHPNKGGDNPCLAPSKGLAAA